MKTCSKCNIPLFPLNTLHNPEQAKWCDQCWKKFWDKQKGKPVTVVGKLSKRPSATTVLVNALEGVEWIMREEELLR